MSVRLIGACLVLVALSGCKEGASGPGGPAAASSPGSAISAPGTSAMVLPGSGPIAQPDDHGDGLALASPLVLDDAAIGVIESQTDRDWFAIDFTTGARYDLAVFSAGSTSLTLFAPDGLTELAHAEGSNPRLAYLVPSDGRYLVRVGSVAGPLDYAVVVSLLTP